MNTKDIKSCAKCGNYVPRENAQCDFDRECKLTGYRPNLVFGTNDCENFIQGEYPLFWGSVIW